MDDSCLRLNLGILVLIKTGPAAQLLSCQWQDRCHLASLVMYSSGAKSKKHCFNISRDTLDGVLYCFSETTYDVITFLTKMSISLKLKKIFYKQKRHSSML